MSLNDIRSLEGQPWSTFRRQVHHVYRKSSITQELRSNSLILKYEDRALYGKYAGFEPFVLALCGFCGEKFKIPVLARHIALKHSDGRVRESYKNSQKAEVKNYNLYGKKSKLKGKKEVAESPPQINCVKDNKSSSKINHSLNHHVDKKKVNQVSLFSSKHQSDSRDDKSNLEASKNEKKINHKVESPQAKKTNNNNNNNNTKEYATYLKPCTKDSIIKSPDDHLFLSPSKEKYDSRRFRSKLMENPKRENEKFKVDVIKDVTKNTILPISNANGIRQNIEMNREIIPCNPFVPFDICQKKKKDATKRFREFKKNSIDNMKARRYALKQPWYRKHGGLLYTQNNLPTFLIQKNIRKEKKKRKRKYLYSFPDREDDPKHNIDNLRDLDTLCIQRRLRNPTIYDFRDWSVERKRQIVSPASACTLKHYTIEEMQKVYFRMIPDTINSPNINLQSEYLGVAYPPPVLKGSVGPENQFYVQKLRDYCCFDKYLTRLRRTKGNRWDRDERYFFRNLPDGNVMILEPVITRKPFVYPEIVLEHLDSTPYRTVKVPTKEERTWNVAMGTWKGDGGVALETLNRMHFTTPSGPMSARFVQLPIYPDVVVPQAPNEPGKSKVEE